MPKGTIKIHTDVLSTWDALSDAEWGRLIKAMLAYRLSGQTQQLQGAERIMFPSERVKIDEDLAREESRRKKTRERVTRYRDNVTLCNALQSVTERYPPSLPPSPPTPPVSPNPTPKEKPPKGGKKKVPFCPPTVSEVRDYCLERSNGIDPEAFVDHYQANGWVQGRGKPIVDWKAAVRTWEKNRKERGMEPVQPSGRGPCRIELDENGEEVVVFE